MSLLLDPLTAARNHASEVFAEPPPDQTWLRTPGTLAQKLDPTTVQTPMLALLDAEMLEVRDAIAMMFARRARFLELVGIAVEDASDSGLSAEDFQAAINQTVIDVPDAGNNRLLVSAAPQEGKSRRITRYGVEWLLRQFPQLRAGIVSFDGSAASQWSYEIRGDIELYNGTEGRLDLGLRLVKDAKAMSHWRLIGGGGVYAIGIGGGLTSRPLDALFLDDLVKDPRAADSVLQSLRAWAWYTSVARPRLAPWAPVVGVGTRWHESDPIGRLLAQQKADTEAGLTDIDRWRYVNIPAQADHRPELGEVDLLGREPGEFMVSARGRTREQWEAAKAGASSPRVWSALFQGKPSPVEGSEIKRAWWRYSDIVPARPDAMASSWDMKLKEKRSGDYVAGGMFARVGSKFYLLAMMRGQWDFATVTNAIALMSVRYPSCTRHLVENTGNGPEVMSGLRKADPDYEVSDAVAGELGMTADERVKVQALRRRGLSGLIPQNPKGSKVARVRAISGIIEAGDVILPGQSADRCPRWVTTFVDECSAFGIFSGGHDDQIDALSQALRAMHRGSEEKQSQVPQGRVPGTREPSTSNMARARRIPLRTASR